MPGGPLCAPPLPPPQKIAAFPDMGAPFQLAVHEGCPVVFVHGWGIAMQAMKHTGNGWRDMDAGDALFEARLLSAQAFHERWQPG